MLYPLLRVWTRLALQFYFKKIEVSGVEKIPQDGPLLLLANHPNSFMEACLLSCFQPRELNYLVRGDLFEKKWLKPILDATHQIPIYRMKDGIANLKKNKSSFSISYEILKKEKAILLFPEASTLYVPFLRPLQKGAARLVTGAKEENDISGLKVICCSVHYTDAFSWRSNVYLKFSELLDVDQYYKKAEEKSDHLTRLTDQFAYMLRTQHFDYRETEPRIHLDHLISIVESKYNDHCSEKINSILEQNQDAEERTLLTQDLKLYHQGQKSFFADRFATKSVALQFILLLFYFIVSIPSIILLIPVFYLIHKAVSRKIKHKEFVPPISVAANMVYHLLISTLVLISFTSICNFWFGLAAFIILQFSLYASSLLKDKLKLVGLFLNEETKGRFAQYLNIINKYNI